MQNRLIFSSSMGFSIFGVLLYGIGVGIFEIMLLGGISGHIG